MARSMFPDSAGSQFFLMHKDAPHLDGDYAAFGKVIEGMDVVDKIAETPTNFFTDAPEKPHRNRRDLRSRLSRARETPRKVRIHAGFRPY